MAEWTPSSSKDVAYYIISNGGYYVKLVASTGPFVYKEVFQKHYNDYAVTVVGANGLLSSTIPLLVVNHD